MGLLPVMVVFGLSFPPVFFELLVALLLFLLFRRVLQPTGLTILFGIRRCLIPRCTAVCST